MLQTKWGTRLRTYIPSEVLLEPQEKKEGRRVDYIDYGFVKQPRIWLTTDTTNMMIEGRIQNISQSTKKFLSKPGEPT